MLVRNRASASNRVFIMIREHRPQSSTDQCTAIRETSQGPTAPTQCPARRDDYILQASFPGPHPSQQTRSPAWWAWRRTRSSLTVIAGLLEKSSQWYGAFCERRVAMADWHYVDSSAVVTLRSDVSVAVPVGKNEGGSHYRSAENAPESFPCCGHRAGDRSGRHKCDLQAVRHAVPCSQQRD